MNTSNKIFALMQPTYIPWIGYFDLIDQVDIFVFLDDVQIEKNSWQTRNKIKTSQGELFLSVSRKKNKGNKLQLIKDVELNDTHRWRNKHVKSIELVYKKSQYFNDIFPIIKSLIESNKNKLSEFNINIIKELCKILGIKTKFILSSEIHKIDGIKDHKVVSICKNIGCESYLSPIGAATYIDEKSPGGEFIKKNISLYYHNYKHPIYNQQQGEFIPYLSIIDILFNEGPKKSYEILKSGRLLRLDYAKK